MRRRQLVLAILVVAPIALNLHAQTGANIPRVGILIVGTAASTGGVARAVIEGMRERGYVEGRNVRFESRFGDGSREQVERNARDLVEAKVDVIVSPATAAVSATKKATSTIPIVFCAVSDPVASGFVRSLPAPGGNISGISVMAAEMGAKRIEILNEVLPKLKRIGVLHNPQDPASVLHLQSTLQGAKSLGKDVLVVEVVTPADFNDAFSRLEKWRAEALAIGEAASFFTHRKSLLARAAKNRWPTVSSTRQWAEDGSVISYGVDYNDSCRQSAAYVVRILKGAKPAELPVERPSKFEFVINMKTAKAFGLSIPPSVLLRVDQVIE